jgi:3',5'-cyclic AMP phosphodiesterase CpdA
MILVSLDHLKKALVVDFDDDDDILQAYLETASAAVLKYLKIDADDLAVITGDIVNDDDLPVQAKTAAVMLAGILYRNRDGDPDKEWEQGYLPKPITALLYGLRDPTLA